MELYEVELASAFLHKRKRESSCYVHSIVSSVRKITLHWKRGGIPFGRYGTSNIDEMGENFGSSTS